MDLIVRWGGRSVGEGRSKQRVEHEPDSSGGAPPEWRRPSKKARRVGCRKVESKFPSTIEPLRQRGRSKRPRILPPETPRPRMSS